MTLGPGPQAVPTCLCVLAHGLPAGSSCSGTAVPPSSACNCQAGKPGMGSLPKMQGHHGHPCIPCLGRVSG